MGEFLKEEIIIEENNREIYGVRYLPKEVNKCPIVIFSHGYNGSNSDFYDNAEILAKNGIASYCFDFCGGSVRAKSSMKTEDMTIVTEKEDLKAVINRVKAWSEVDNDNIFLFGASQGGFISSLVADEYKDEIRGVILLFPAFCIPDNWTEKYESIDEIPEDIDFWGMKLGAGFIKSVYKFNIYDNIGKYDKKILFLHGDNDLVVPYEYTVDISKRYKNSDVIIFKGEGHGFSKEGNNKVSNVLLDFIEENKHK